MPAGALQVVHGAGSDLGPVLSQHPAVAKISFTGSTAAGVDVFRRGAGNFKRLTLECGSNDAAVILRDADLALAASVVANLGMRTYSGQICTAPKRCIVAKEIYNGFEKLLAGEASRIVAGDPMDERTELGPLVNQRAAEQVERQVTEAVAAGARVVSGGRRSGAFFSRRRSSPTFRRRIRSSTRARSARSSASSVPPTRTRRSRWPTGRATRCAPRSSAATCNAAAAVARTTGRQRRRGQRPVSGR